MRVSIEYRFLPRSTAAPKSLSQLMNDSDFKITFVLNRSICLVAFEKYIYVFFLRLQRNVCVCVSISMFALCFPVDNCQTNIHSFWEAITLVTISIE